jgi:hypothetical protein
MTGSESKISSAFLLNDEWCHAGEALATPLDHLADWARVGVVVAVAGRLTPG